MLSINWDSSENGIFSTKHDADLQRPPRYMATLIWLVLLILAAALLWAWFGEIDHVVKATGVIRPQANVSTVRNIVGGKVKMVGAREGDHVEQGDLLLIIDTDTADLKIKSLTAELHELEEQLSGLELLKEWMLEGAWVLDCEEGFDSSGLGRSNFFQTICHRYYSFKTQYDQLVLAYQEAEINCAKQKKVRAVPEHELYRLEREQAVAKLRADNYLYGSVAAVAQEIAAKSEQLKRIRDQIAEVESTKQLSCICAPISGIIQVSSQINAEEYLPSGYEIARIIPGSGQELCVEISVRNQDIALIETGQTIIHSFEALPRHTFGTVKGKITGIGGDAVVVGDGNLVYRATASIEQTILWDPHGNEVELKPGMVCQSQVVVKRDKILYWLLQKLGFIN